MDQTFEKRKKLIYDFICDEFYVPMKLKELAILLQVPKDRRNELKQVLDELEAEGKVHVSSKGKYTKGESKRIVGTFTAHARGFGFVTVEGAPEDIFISEDDINGAFHNDTVEVIIKAAPQGKRKEGKIIKVLAHGTTTLVGYFQRNKNFGFVLPDNEKFAQDVFVPLERSKGAVTGHKVVVELTKYGEQNRKPEGKVIEILGHVNDPGVDILSIVKGYDLPMAFPEKVLSQAERVAKELTIPVIGIGAGGGVDGQVLVVSDMLGMTNGFSPRFLRRYADLHSVMTNAISQYIEDVKNCDFPNEKEQY